MNYYLIGNILLIVVVLLLFMSNSNKRKEMDNLKNAKKEEIKKAENRITYTGFLNKQMKNQALLLN